MGVITDVRCASSPPRDGTRLTVRVFGDATTRTTVAQVVTRNPTITDPDAIRTGQRLRIPVQG